MQLVLPLIDEVEVIKADYLSRPMQCPPPPSELSSRALIQEVKIIPSSCPRTCQMLIVMQNKPPSTLVLPAFTPFLLPSLIFQSIRMCLSHRGELTLLYPSTNPHLFDYFLILHHQPSGLQNLLQRFENTLER